MFDLNLTTSRQPNNAELPGSQHFQMMVMNRWQMSVNTRETTQPTFKQSRPRRAVLLHPRGFCERETCTIMDLATWRPRKDSYLHFYKELMIAFQHGSASNCSLLGLIVTTIQKA